MRTVVFSLILSLLVSVYGQSKSFVPKVVSGKKVEKSVSKVMSTLHWKRSLEDVKEIAKKSGKMIFWLQIVGDLDGGL